MVIGAIINVIFLFEEVVYTVLWFIDVKKKKVNVLRIMDACS